MFAQRENRQWRAKGQKEERKECPRHPLHFFVMLFSNAKCHASLHSDNGPDLLCYIHQALMTRLDSSFRPLLCIADFLGQIK